MNFALKEVITGLTELHVHLPLTFVQDSVLYLLFFWYDMVTHFIIFRYSLLSLSVNLDIVDPPPHFTLEITFVIYFSKMCCD